MRRIWDRLTAGLGVVVALRVFKPALFVACGVPAGILAYRLCQFFLWDQTDVLGPDPATTVIHETGRDALGLLLITLSVTPIRRIFALNRLQASRRMLGVWSFTYAAMHLSAYLVFNQLCYSWATCDLKGIAADVLKRKFIFIGMFAWTILFALAITSTSGWVRRLKKKWQTLHRLVYVAAIAGVIHFAWGQKADIREPLKWGAILAVLLAFRVYLTMKKRGAARA
jgi:methionine sulfoxide reductase heme-binding subunit